MNNQIKVSDKRHNLFKTSVGNNQFRNNRLLLRYIFSFNKFVNSSLEKNYFITKVIRSLFNDFYLNEWKWLFLNQWSC